MPAREAKRAACCPPEKRWRPRQRAGPVCGYSFDEKTCRKRGAHYCEPRADRVVAFFAEILVHTKGRWARQAFVLDDWQELEIIRPVFGEVLWSDEWGCYVRRYRVVYIVLGRKNGKSELAAGIVLTLLVADDEEGAEVYGAAKDTKQAGKVADVVLRMRQLAPDLVERLTHNKNQRRLIDEQTNSYYEVITADALGELGHNPHGFVLDEVLSQPDGTLWDAMRTAAGARTQPMFVLITTETNDPDGFGAEMIDEAERVQEDPARAPHVFAYVRKMDSRADPYEEKNWAWPNPALGRFLTYEALRQDALDARNDPTKENAFRQFRCNQRTQQRTRWMPLHLWDAAAGEVWANPDWRLEELKGRACFGGLDLSAKLDLTSWCLLFPDDDGGADVLWRFWLPETMVPTLDSYTGGQMSVWVRDGWIIATEGDTIRYSELYEAIAADHETFAIHDEISYDVWQGEAVMQEIYDRTGLEGRAVNQTYDGLSEGMNEVMRLTKAQKLRHHANPVMRWNADSAEAKSPSDNPDLVRIVKPDRARSGKRVDGMVTLVMAVSGWLASQAEGQSAYESRGLTTLGG